MNGHVWNLSEEVEIVEIRTSCEAHRLSTSQEALRPCLLDLLHNPDMGNFKTPILSQHRLLVQFIRNYDKMVLISKN